MPAPPAPAYDGPTAEIGVIGGSGFYAFFGTGAEQVHVETPWGPPSDPLTIGEVAGRTVAFVPRHGRDHRFPPHRVPYRATMWALAAAGVRQVLAPCAVGSLRAEVGPGTVVVPDQIVDRTWGRAHTFVDADAGVLHATFADPYCPRGRAAVLRHVAAAPDATGAAGPVGPVDGGTLVVVNGPRFSSRAESRWHAAQGWTVVGMTGMPEAALARELGLCYTAIALVTDHDAGVDGGDAVTHEEVLRVFAVHVASLRAAVQDVIPHLPTDPQVCICGAGFRGVTTPFPTPAPVDQPSPIGP